MRAELTIARCGFAVQINELDMCSDERVIVRVMLFWKSYIPRREWRVGLYVRDRVCGHVSFTSAVNGNKKGWMIQGPIVRIHG